VPPSPADHAKAQELIESYAGRHCSQFCVGTGIRLDLDGLTHPEIIIESPFNIHRNEVSVWEGEPLSPGALTELLALLMQTVSRIRIEVDGSLALLFGNGARLRVPVDQMYEAWQIRADNGLLIVCLPGGDLSVWSATNES
jgi:hypothetical protein